MLHLRLDFCLKNIIPDLLLEILAEFLAASHIFPEEFLLLVIKVGFGVLCDGVVCEVDELVSEVLGVVLPGTESNVRVLVESDIQRVPACHNNLQGKIRHSWQLAKLNDYPLANVEFSAVNK